MYLFVYKAYYKSNLTAANAVITIIKIRKGFSFIFFTMIAPKKAPKAIAGSILKSSAKDFKVMLCQNKICKGSLVIFIKKKNQAVVPRKLFFLKPMASKYTLNIGPAAFPIMEVKPATTPMKE